MTHTHTGADTYKELYTWLLRAPLFPAQSCFSAALVKGKNLLPLCPRRLFLLRRFLIQIRITIKTDLCSASAFFFHPFFFSFLFAMAQIWVPLCTKCLAAVMLQEFDVSSRGLKQGWGTSKRSTDVEGVCLKCLLTRVLFYLKYPATFTQMHLIKMRNAFFQRSWCELGTKGWMYSTVVFAMASITLDLYAFNVWTLRDEVGRWNSGINTMLTFCPMEFANEGKKMLRFSRCNCSLLLNSSD